MPVIYRIDRDDLLVSVNEAWTKFALENGGAAVLPPRILGQSLWTQITDETLQELYRLMLVRVRAGHTLQFQFRCDAPARRRTFEMTISPVEDGGVEFSSQLASEESRAPVGLLELGRARDERMLTICSWCQRAALPEALWVPVEEAVQHFGCLEEGSVPRVTHGICPSCAQKAFGYIAARARDGK